MSWTVTPTQLLVDDQDALTYLTAVETADGQALESGVRLAVNTFVKGCKADGIWPAIKACCILAGARTTNGALVPLVGAAPTPFNFDLVNNTDYHRKTGLKGDASTKYLNPNRNQTSDPWANKHLSLYVSELPTSANLVSVIGGRAGTVTHSAIQTRSSGEVAVGLDDLSSSTGFSMTAPSFLGAARNNVVDMTYRFNATTRTRVRASTGSGVSVIRVFGQDFNDVKSNPRLSFYSIGESLDLALLDARVTALINAFGTAIA